MLMNPAMIPSMRKVFLPIPSFLMAMFAMLESVIIPIRSMTRRSCVGSPLMGVSMSVLVAFAYSIWKVSVSVPLM